MQKCLICGKDIKYIATGPGKNTPCDVERLHVITENGRQVYGYLVHNCKRAELQNGKEENRKEENN